MQIPRSILIAAFIFSSARPAVALAAVVYNTTALPEIVTRADTIVLGDVVAVTSDAAGDRRVTVRVREVWKGPVTAELEYFIPILRLGCDTSDGKPGETVVLFLARQPTTGRLVIVELGRGRMRVQGTQEQQVVVLTVPPPEELPAMPTPVPSGGMGTGVKIYDLKEYVSNVLRGPTNP